MIARGTEAQVSVLALVGERGREVREFLERDLGPEGLARSVVVVATSDQPALVRLRAAFTATRIAEWFRDQGMRRRPDDGQPHPLRHGPAGGRPVGRRAARHPGLPAVGVLAAAPAAGAGRRRRARQHHRPVHGARRRRRHGRADRRLRPLDPRRPRRAVPPAGLGRPLPDHRGARLDLPGVGRRHHAGAEGRRRRAAPPAGRRAGGQGPRRDRRLRARHQPRRRPGPGPVGRHPQLPLPGHGRRRPGRRQLGPPGRAARDEPAA